MKSKPQWLIWLAYTPESLFQLPMFYRIISYNEIEITISCEVTQKDTGWAGLRRVLSLSHPNFKHGYWILA